MLPRLGYLRTKTEEKERSPCNCLQRLLQDNENCLFGGSTLLQHSSFLLVVHADVVGVEDGVVHLVAHAVGGVEFVAAGAGHRGCGGGTRPAVTDKFVAAAAFAVARGQAEKAQGG